MGRSNHDWRQDVENKTSEYEEKYGGYQRDYYAPEGKGIGKGYYYSIVDIFGCHTCKLGHYAQRADRILHIPPEEHYFAPLNESGLQKDHWYKFSTNSINLTSLKQELAASTIDSSVLSGRYDLRSSLQDKDTREIYHIGYAGDNSESCHAFVKNEHKVLCDPGKVSELQQKIDDALEHRYLTRFFGWLLHL